MDSFVIGWISAIIAVGVGYGIGLHHAGIFKKEKQPQFMEITKEDIEGGIEFKEPEPKQSELGAVKRPEPEDLEKKENPRIEEEEEAWEDDISLLPGVAKMFISPYKGLWTF